MHLTSSQKIYYTINMPSNRIPDKDQHWNNIQYKLELESYLLSILPSHAGTKKWHDAETKFADDQY